MGAIAPLATQGLGLISTITGAVNTINRAANVFESPTRDLRQEQNLALQQLQQRQVMQEQQIASDTALDRERIAADTDASERQRQNALRRAVARQQASFGGRGISTDNGSARAVLLGLFDESEEELAERIRLDSLRYRAIDLNQSNTQSLNVLQRTQLQERQRLERSLF